MFKDNLKKITSRTDEGVHKWSRYNNKNMGKTTKMNHIRTLAVNQSQKSVDNHLPSKNH